MYAIFYVLMINVLSSIVRCVPRKGFGSAGRDTKYTIYLHLCTQTADPNLFRGTNCN